MGKQELLDRARDELFSHIHRCGVLQAAESDQDSWMNETIEYLAERYPDLGVAELGELKTVGLRFCKPVISRLKKEEAPAEESPEEPTEAVAEDGAAEAPVAAGEVVPAAEPSEDAQVEVPVDGAAAVGAA